MLTSKQENILTTKVTLPNCSLCQETTEGLLVLTLEAFSKEDTVLTHTSSLEPLTATEGRLAFEKG